MKVRALANGFYNGSKVMKGEIFYIKPKKGKRSPNKGLTDHLVDIDITEEQQFSKYWMERLDEPENPELDQAHNDALRESIMKESLVSKGVSKSEMKSPDGNKSKSKKKSKKESVEETESEEVI